MNTYRETKVSGGSRPSRLSKVLRDTKVRKGGKIRSRAEETMTDKGRDAKLAQTEFFAEIRKSLRCDRARRAKVRKPNRQSPARARKRIFNSEGLPVRSARVHFKL